MQVHSKNRPLREELYRAFITRASSGDSDNTPIIQQILKLRKERAALLGYSCHAEVSMASKVPCRSSSCSLAPCMTLPGLGREAVSHKHGPGETPDYSGGLSACSSSHCLPGSPPVHS